MDHLGLVSILARRSGAEVAALDLLAPWAARYFDGMEADDAFANSVMTEHGIPEDMRLALLSVSQSYRNWGAAATVTRPLAAGSDLGCATARCASCTAPATRRRTRSSTTPSARSCSAPTTSSSTSPPTR